MPSEGGMMEPLPQRFCPPSELGSPQRTRVSTFPQRRRLRLSNRDKLLNPRQSYISTDSRAEPKDQTQNQKRSSDLTDDPLADMFGPKYWQPDPNQPPPSSKKNPTLNEI